MTGDSLIDEARILADNERLSDEDLRGLVRHNSRAAEIAIELREADRAADAGAEARALGIPVLW